jgi:hypothetical protein
VAYCNKALLVRRDQNALLLHGDSSIALHIIGAELDAEDTRRAVIKNHSRQILIESSEC